jgi:hypothetical protein
LRGFLGTLRLRLRAATPGPRRRPPGEPPPPPVLKQDVGIKTIVLSCDWELAKEARRNNDRKMGRVPISDDRYRFKNKEAYVTYRTAPYHYLSIEAFDANNDPVAPEGLARAVLEAAEQ